MTHLKEGETYNIETIEDLWNCPQNMMVECIQALKEIFTKRLEIELEKGYSITIKNPVFTLTNDGKDEMYMDWKDLEKER